MSRLFPRLRGMAYQEGPGWTWEIAITIGSDMADLRPIVMGPPKDSPPFISKDAALNDMRAMIPGLMKTICEAMDLPPPEGVIDLVANESKTFDEFAAPTTFPQPKAPPNDQL